MLVTGIIRSRRHLFLVQPLPSQWLLQIQILIPPRFMSVKQMLSHQNLVQEEAGVMVLPMDLPQELALMLQLVEMEPLMPTMSLPVMSMDRLVKPA